MVNLSLENFEIWLNDNLSQKNKEAESNWNAFFAEIGRMIWILKKKPIFFNNKIAEVLSDFAT